MTEDSSVDDGTVSALANQPGLSGKGHEAPSVLYLGPENSFSHLAAQSTPVSRHATLYPAPDFPTIFYLLQQSALSSSPSASDLRGTRYEFAVLPVRNSTNGLVLPVMELLARAGHSGNSIAQQLLQGGLARGLEKDAAAVLASFDSATTALATPASGGQATYPDLVLRGQFDVGVHHHLYVHPQCPVPEAAASEPVNRGLPDSADLSSITSLHTHPQVWTQCVRFLHARFPHSTAADETGASLTNGGKPSNTPLRHSHASTSDAAAYVARTLSDGDTSQGWPAVICASMAGEHYGLKCVARFIEDDTDGNRTTFVLLGTRDVADGGA